ncbi:hypothetical protein BS17DRAFT_816004 [Gyrodon lividus]|nr:hypothetical protein BS17DRAFT_816004 [Gyrodon lividus]
MEEEETWGEEILQMKMKEDEEDEHNDHANPHSHIYPCSHIYPHTLNHPRARLR